MTRTIYPVFLKDNECIFTVWAPWASSVNIVLMPEKKRVKMAHQERGYWVSTVKDVTIGTRYFYEIDNEGLYPDPASLSQPDGVHEASELIRLFDYKWTDDDWKNIPLEEMIQYELHTGTFTPEGTFDGAAQKLGYLKDLGINTIEVLPVSQFSGHRNWGYDGVYPFAVQSSYGGAKALMDLVNECHRNGIAVIMDVVYNHFGPEGNYVGNFGEYFSGKYSTPWGKPLNFDGEHSDEVRNYFVQNALMWFRDFHMDGLRLDAVHAIFDFNAEHILAEISKKAEELSDWTGKPYYLIAESHLNDVKYTNGRSKGGYGLDAQWSDDFHHSIHALTTGEKSGYYADFGTVDHLAKAIKSAFVYDGVYSEFRKKSYGSKTHDIPGHQFVIFNQNHDQIGNRLRGERLISLVGFETAKLIGGCMFITPNIPMLFMGEEYGEARPFYYFVSHLDDKLNKLVRKGRAQEFKVFGYSEKEAKDPSDLQTFEDSKLSWGIEEDPLKKAMYGYYKELISLKKKLPALKYPNKSQLNLYRENHLFIVERWNGDNTVMAIMNFGQKELLCQIPPTLNKSLIKKLDSADIKWNGTGLVCPDNIKANQQFKIQQDTIVIYSNY